MAAVRGSLDTPSSVWIHEATTQMAIAPKHRSLTFSLKRLSHTVMSWRNGNARRNYSWWARAGVGRSKGESGVSFEVLGERLGAGQWQLADEETRRLLILLSGEAAVKRNYIFFSEVQFIPAADLNTIDGLWRSYSNNRFGYSVQRRIWKKVAQDFTSFFKKVGWMKRLDTEIEQYTYRSFPSEFIWDLTDSTPEGHLPLTNALRGTQLLASIFAHPAFDSIQSNTPNHLHRTFTPDYIL